MEATVDSVVVEVVEASVVEVAVMAEMVDLLEVQNHCSHHGWAERAAVSLDLVERRSGRD